MNEIWKDIQGYEGLYKISSLGRVKKKEIRKQSKGNHGYWVIDLYRNNKRKTYLVHRLIAQVFISNPYNKKTINHIDGIRDNNSLENLEWCTQSENIKHAFDVLGYRNNFQTNHPKPSLGKFGIEHPASKPINQLKNGMISLSFNSAMDAVRQGFTSSHITECCQGKRKSHRGFQWQYA